MSRRHRRQASQAIPPEILAADDLTKPFDLKQPVTTTITEDAAVGTTTTTATTSQHQEEITKESSIALSTASPANTKKPPAEKSTWTEIPTVGFFLLHLVIMSVISVAPFFFSLSLILFYVFLSLFKKKKEKNM